MSYTSPQSSALSSQVSGIDSPDKQGSARSRLSLAISFCGHSPLLLFVR